MSIFCGHAGMRRRDRSGQQCLDSAETWCADRNCCAIHESLRLSDSAFEFETHNPAKAIEEFARPRVPWMALKAGVVHAIHCRMIFEKTGDRECTLVLIPHSNRKGLHS